MTRQTYDLAITVSNEYVDTHHLNIITDKEVELVTDSNNKMGILWIGNMTEIQFPENVLVELVKLG